MMLADVPRAYRCLIWAVCEAIELACSVQSFDRIVPCRRTSRVIEGLPSKIALRGALWGLFCIVVASGASHAHAQLIGADQVASHARLDTAKAEHESRSRRQSIADYRRNLAHARMREQVPNASSRLACPVFGAESTPLGTRLPRKRVVAQNLPGVPPRARWQNLARRTESVSSIFAQYISGPVVQSRCINCHVQDGISGHTRIVFSPSSEAGHETGNLAVFENFVAAVEGGADTILAKVQGVGHGGGIQVPAGSAEFANMERFVRLLGGGSSGGVISPETLFDGVTMASPTKTLWRAALILAGRPPTREEFNAVRGGGLASLRSTVRSLMAGAGFHEFIVRTANDRLLTDRHLDDEVIDTFDVKWPAVANKNWDLRHAAYARGYEEAWDDPQYEEWIRNLNWGVARAPLELIAHVVENDRPYTEILTADYIMANPDAAEAYGASTRFDDSTDSGEFRPSKIESYYRDDDSKVVEEKINCCARVINPGNLSTDYPHAGVLNTTVFLRRYPSTATNRNRARARWTYYNFLGLDIEKSASRTTDPMALADKDNPTMKNPACAVCHVVMDPVAGTYQNYGDEGLYRDKWGGMDSLAVLYKDPEDGSESPYREGDTWYRDMRAPGFNGALAPNAQNSVQWLAQQIVADERFAEATVKFWWGPIMGSDVAEPPEDTSDASYEGRLLASASQTAEVRRLASAFRSGTVGGRAYNLKDLLAEIVLSPWFRAESASETDPVRTAALRDAGAERLLTPEELLQKTEAITGYSWGRRVEDHVVKTRLTEAWDTYRLLYGGIDSDGIVSRAREVTPLMAAVAQSHAAESSCPIVLREFYLTPNSGRLLFGGIDQTVTPTLAHGESFAITAGVGSGPQTVSTSASLKAGNTTVNLRFANSASHPAYDRNLYLDKLVVRDSDGAIVQSVALETLAERPCGGPRAEEYLLRSTCPLEVPVVVPNGGRYRVEVSARQEAAGNEPARLRMLGQLFDVLAQEEDEWQTIRAETELAEGRQELVLEFANDYWRDPRILIDSLVVRDGGGGIVASLGAEAFQLGCRTVGNMGEAYLNERDHCALQVSLPGDGSYRFDVAARHRDVGTLPALLNVRLSTSGGGSRGETAIRRKIAELHQKLFGNVVALDSPDVEEAFQLFLSVWNRKRASGDGGSFFDGRMCDLDSDNLFLGVAEYDEDGNSTVEWSRIEELLWRNDSFSDADPFYTARTWTVVLAYLMTDYRYLYL